MVDNEEMSESSSLEVHVDAVVDADKKGQMLVIYLPEGSVIVDRTDINLSNAPKEIVASVKQSTPPPQPTPPVEQVTAVAPPVEQVTAVAPPVAPVPPIVERVASAVSSPMPAPAIAQVSEPATPTIQEMISLAVQEALKVKTSVDAQASVSPPVEQPFATPSQRPAPRPMPVLVRRPKRKFNWVHGINTLFVSYILAISILPAILSSAFGVSVWVSKVAHPGASIFSGDLMITSRVLPTTLKANDVILVRDSNSWVLNPRLVTGVTTTGNQSTIGTMSTASLASTSNKSYSVANTSQSFQITRIVPKLGIAVLILSSIVAKILIGLSMLTLNLIVHYRRMARRRRGMASPPNISR